MNDDAKLIIDLDGPGWHAELEVQPPPPATPRTVEFDVPALGQAAGPLSRIATSVVYTSAVNRDRRDGWPDWHVKIYRCAESGEAEALRKYLHRQAVALQKANSRLPDPGRNAIEPPWAVVPVQMVRGDGNREELNGAVITRLGTPADDLAATLRRSLPAWFADGTRPELCLLAVSPSIQLLPWDGYTRWPGTEQLKDFRLLAIGLDELHKLNWAHCDIKPANVCRYTGDTSSGYVLIDTDAAAPISPPPTTLRSTPLFDYGGMRRWRHGPRRPGQGIDPGLLRGQDRFGFAIVVLAALAGKDWVEGTLLHTDAEDPEQQRAADSDTRVVEALGRHWADTRWRPLIEALAEPFGNGPHGQVALESPAPWAAAWLDRVIEAERRCRPDDGGASDAPRRPDPVRYAGDLAAVRRKANAGPKPRPELVRAAFQAIDQRALLVALRSAAGAAAVCALAVLLVATVVAYNAFGLGD